MKVLVTGATGLIGNALVKRLSEAGHRVRALVRDVQRGMKVTPTSVECVPGDVTDRPSVERACEGIEIVFHAAGLPEQYQRDERIFDEVNRKGTANVLEAARQAGVRRAVYTSTMDVFAADRGGTVTEEKVDKVPKHSAYERSKQLAEVEAEAVRQRGLDVVFVNPAAVYGPTPLPTALNAFFIRLLNKKVPMLPPGGMSVAYVDSVVDVHLAALARGQPGQRYLVADAHVTMTQLAQAILAAAGGGNVPIVAPAWLLRTAAATLPVFAKVIPFKPLVTQGELGFLFWNARVDASKAMRELNFKPMPLEEGVSRTVAFLRQEKLVPPANGV